MEEATDVASSAIPRWSEKMRIKDDDDDRKVLSKKLSYVLRHGAKELDLEIDEGGYVCVRDLLACDALFDGVALEALMEVVAQSNQDKQRYEILQQDDGEWLIRATGKHTMQGLARQEKSDKRARRNSNKEVGGSPTSNGDRNRGPRSPGGARPIAEDDFCAKWRLDRLARLRLQDLSPANRQLAMQRFNPGPQVPPSDFPKVFVAFCKRFRMKGKDEKDGYDDEEYPQTPQGGRAVASSMLVTKSSRQKKKPGVPEAAVGLFPIGPLLDDFDSDIFDGGSFPALPTPRSDDDHDSPQARSIHSQGTPVHHPQPPPPPLSPQTLHGSPMLTMPLDMSMNQHGRPRPLTMVPAPPHSPPMGSPQFAPPPKPPGAPPPPTYVPNTRLPADASFRTAPPPPTHAPQVDGFGFGSVEQDCSYQDLSRQHHPGQWGPTTCSPTYTTGQMPSSPQSYSTTPTARSTGASGYQDMMMSQLDYSSGYYDGRNSYGQGMVSHGYHDLPPHVAARSHTGYATQPEHVNYHGVTNTTSQGYRDNFVAGGDWHQIHASSAHGACY